MWVILTLISLGTVKYSINSSYNRKYNKNIIKFKSVNSIHSK